MIKVMLQDLNDDTSVELIENTEDPDFATLQDWLDLIKRSLCAMGYNSILVEKVFKKQ